MLLAPATGARELKEALGSRCWQYFDWLVYISELLIQCLTLVPLVSYPICQATYQ